ncbi:MAG: hypothetical protein QG670_2502 [Thermoproteota archaeon]|nr:hypothetical protein [Thermoproteota archaeon]
MTENKTREKTCFIICPIGEDDSPERKRANDLLEFIISPSLGKFNYKLIRADQISKPGLISSQIIKLVIESDLVITDLHKYNPNVFYELAIRHATRKPYIQLMSKGQNLPFDIQDVRTIFFDMTDIRDINQATRKVEEQINTIVKEKIEEIDTPISQVINIKTLLESRDPQKQGIAIVLQGLNEIRGELKTMQNMLLKQPQWLTGSAVADIDAPANSPFESTPIIYNYRIPVSSISPRSRASVIVDGKIIRLCSNCREYIEPTADSKCPKCGKKLRE